MGLVQAQTSWSFISWTKLQNAMLLWEKIRSKLGKMRGLKFIDKLIKWL